MALEDVTAHLDSIGYQRREPVELVGEYSVRGGILDVYPAEAEGPVRIEFFGDEIESMRRFDVESQRTVLGLRDSAAAAVDRVPEVARAVRGDRCIGWPGARRSPARSSRVGNSMSLAKRPRTTSLLDLMPGADSRMGRAGTGPQCRGAALETAGRSGESPSRSARGQLLPAG